MGRLSHSSCTPTDERVSDVFSSPIGRGGFKAGIIRGGCLTKLLRANILGTTNVPRHTDDKMKADGQAKLIILSSYHSQTPLNVQSCQDEDIRHWNRRQDTSIRNTQILWQIQQTPGLWWSSSVNVSRSTVLRSTGRSEIIRARDKYVYSLYRLVYCKDKDNYCRKWAELQANEDKLTPSLARFVYLRQQLYTQICRSLFLFPDWKDSVVYLPMIRQAAGQL